MISRRLCGVLPIASESASAAHAIVRKTAQQAKLPSTMSFVSRVNYYRRISSAYLLPGKSQLTFWHDHPRINPAAAAGELGQYYMPFSEKADYIGPYDPSGIPLLNYHGNIGLQYNPIAIAQWGL